MVINNDAPEDEMMIRILMIMLIIMIKNIDDIIDKYLYRLSLKRGRWAGTQAGRRKFSFERNIWWPAHYLQDDDHWWHWWWQDDENDDCCKDVARSASPNQLIIRLLPISPSGWISGFCRKNFFLSFPLHLTQIALKTIKISNITFFRLSTFMIYIS